MSHQQEKTNKNNKMVFIVIIVIIIIVGTTVLLINKNKNTGESGAEKEMSRLVTEYYEQNIKGKVIGINQQKVTLQALENAGYDISAIMSRGEYDKTKSYSLVIIENPGETDTSKIVYKVENHLDGK